MKPPVTIVIHGGAGNIRQERMPVAKQQRYRQGLEKALDSGYQLLADGRSAADAVEAAVKSMEDFPLFNAGKGAVVDHNGKIEMEASIMNGRNLEAGAAVGLRHTRNPIALARLIMDRSQHILLNGEGAEQFAREHQLMMEEVDYFITEHRYDQWVQLEKEGSVSLDHNAPEQNQDLGTVGAVALDQNGHVAAATSTGGMVNKQYHRIGDTPIIGAGTYADDHWGAVSSTGHGEYFMRLVAAYSVIAMMEFGKMNLQQSAELLIHEKLQQLGGQGGVIAVNPKGDIAMPFNSPGMFRAYKKGDQEPYLAMFA